MEGVSLAVSDSKLLDMFHSIAKEIGEQERQKR
jgi:hypothetical protein